MNRIYLSNNWSIEIKGEIIPGKFDGCIQHCIKDSINQCCCGDSLSCDQCKSTFNPSPEELVQLELFGINNSWFHELKRKRGLV